jgi:hypothetical protein
MRASVKALLLVCAIAAAVPLFGTLSPPAPIGSFPGWPTRFAGKALRPLPLGRIEYRFSRDFPGHVGRFSDGEREIVMRWVAQETRKLHPASDCFRGSGYSITPRPLALDPDGSRWGTFIATRGTERLQVRERIYDASGNQWTDVSAWYWSAATGKSRGPWWAITIASQPMASQQRDLPPERLALEVQ